MSLYVIPIRVKSAVAVLTLAGLGVALAAFPASAHVTVSADDPSQGADDSILTFRVPNEMDNATSVKLDIKFPAATPLAQVDPEPVAGYAVTTKSVAFNPPLVTDDGTIKSGVGEVTWTATSPSTGVPVGDFTSFRVLVGPLPTKVTQLVFPAVQTYSNGQVVSWVQPTTDPANPPEHPAATLQLTAAGGSNGSSASPGGNGSSASPGGNDSSASPGGNGSSASPAPADSAPGAGSTSAPAASSGAAPGLAAAPAADLSRYATTSQADTGKTLGIVGIVVGALGLLVGGAGIARGRSRS